MAAFGSVVAGECCEAMRAYAAAMSLVRLQYPVTMSLTLPPPQLFGVRSREHIVNYDSGNVTYLASALRN